MIAARLAWEEEAAPIRRQLRLRSRAANASELAVLDRKPAPDAAVEIGLQAWGEVSTERAIGMALGPVPMRAYDAWNDRHGLDPIAADFLKSALMHVDGIVLERIANQARLKGSA